MILVAQLSVTHVDKGLPLDAPGGGSLSSLARYVGKPEAVEGGCLFVDLSIWDWYY